MCDEDHLSISDDQPNEPRNSTPEHSMEATECHSFPRVTPSAPQKDIPFPLMKLPPELRLNAYGHLFTDLTINRQRVVADLTTYHPWQNWPDNDFTAYLNLLRTCSEVCNEAKGLWEKEYVRQCCLYFRKPHKLYRAAMLLAALGEPYQHVRYALRSESPHELLDREEPDSPENQSEELMKLQPGFPEKDYASFQWPHKSFLGEWYGVNPRIPCVHHEAEDKLQTTDRADFLGLENCSITRHRRKVHKHDRRIQRKSCPPDQFGMEYLLMSGEVGDIHWRGYDAALGHALLEIAEEWQRRGHPYTCIGKSDVVLTWRAKVMSGQDEAWLALGGDRNSLENLDLMETDLELGDWVQGHY